MIHEKKRFIYIFTLPVEPKVAARFTHNSLIVVIHFSVTNATRINRGSVWILTIEYDRLIPWINLSNVNYILIMILELFLLQITLNNIISKNSSCLLNYSTQHKKNTVISQSTMPFFLFFGLLRILLFAYSANYSFIFAFHSIKSLVRICIPFY